jgi:hypothetical protein
MPSRKTKLRKLLTKWNLGTVAQSFDHAQSELTNIKDALREKLTAKEVKKLSARLTLIADFLNKSKSFTASEFQNLTQQLEGIKKELAVDKLADVRTQLDSLGKDIATTKEELKLDKVQPVKAQLEGDLKTLRADLLKVAQGGGQAAPQININSSVISTRYADINWIPGSVMTITKADDNVKKRVNLTISGIPSSITTAIIGGADTQVQFNNAGVFGGSSGFTYNQSTSVLTAPGLVNLTAGQLQFPATQNPSSGANTLDDYEEGSWTPVLAGAGGTSGQTYADQTGTYIKIGKFVFLWGHILLSNKGTITGSCIINGLPFTSENVNNNFGFGVVTYFGVLAVGWVQLGCYINPNATNGILIGTTAAQTTISNPTTTDISNTTELLFGFMYRAPT